MTSQGFDTNPMDNAQPVQDRIPGDTVIYASDVDFNGSGNGYPIPDERARQYMNPIPQNRRWDGRTAPLRELAGGGYPTDPKIDEVDVPIQSYPMYVGGAAAVRSTIQLPFVAKSVMLNNVTGQWWWCNFLDTWVPPFYTLAVINLPHGTPNADVNPDTPPTFTSVYTANQIFALVFFDVMQPTKGGTLLKLPT